jgi:hypothetical protein
LGLPAPSDTSKNFLLIWFLLSFFLHALSYLPSFPASYLPSFHLFPPVDFFKIPFYYISMIDEDDLKEIPYAVSDFEEFRESNYYFVDKTRYIRNIEKKGRYLFFIRPRRFLEKKENYMSSSMDTIILPMRFYRHRIANPILTSPMARDSCGRFLMSLKEEPPGAAPPSHGCL